MLCRRGPATAPAPDTPGTWDLSLCLVTRLQVCTYSVVNPLVLRLCLHGVTALHVCATTGSAQPADTLCLKPDRQNLDRPSSTCITVLGSTSIPALQPPISMPPYPPQSCTYLRVQDSGQGVQGWAVPLT